MRRALMLAFLLLGVVAPLSACVVEPVGPPPRAGAGWIRGHYGPEGRWIPAHWG